MGYTTDFHGRFDLDKPLSAERVRYLRTFSETRRMKRNAKALAKIADPVREAVGLPIGTDGEFFVGSTDNYGQDRTPDIVEYNAPPKTQPGLWCQWEPTEDGLHIEWNGAEKFYYYVEWIEYLIENFLKPWGHKLSGKVRWQGEETDDRGIISIKDNLVQSGEDVILNPLDEEEQEEKSVKSATGVPPIVVKTVKSSSSKATYEVRLSRTDGRLYCTCKGWQMRKTCKHLDETTKEDILAALAKAGDEGGIGL